MKIKNILCGALVIPALLIAGCNKGDGDGDTPPTTPETKIEYVEVSQADTVAFFNQMRQEEKLNINGYDFSVTMAAPLDFDGDLGEEGSSESIWPDVSDSTKWEKVTMSGSITNNDDNLEFKYVLTEGTTTSEIYVKGNTVYSNSEEGKFKATIDSEDILEELNLVETLPSTEKLLEQLDMISASDSGLKFEKAESEGKVYYHVSSIPNLSQGEPGISIDMDVPIDLYMVFENNQLVSYEYKLFMMFIYMEFEVSARTNAIEFPEDLDSYIVEDNSLDVEE